MPSVTKIALYAPLAFTKSQLEKNRATLALRDRRLLLALPLLITTLPQIAINARRDTAKLALPATIVRNVP